MSVPTSAVAKARESTSMLTKAGEFLELTKPRLSSLVLFVVFLGAWLAGGGIESWQAVLATGTVAADAEQAAEHEHLERTQAPARKRAAPRPAPARVEPSLQHHA